MVRECGLDLQNLRNDKVNYEQTALFEACAFKDHAKASRLVQFFLDQGVDPLQEDNLKQLPLFYAVREGHNDIIDLLIQRRSDVNHIDTYGQTPIFYCVREGNNQTIQKLVSYGANIDIIDQNGQTPLFYAIKSGRFETVEYLI